MESVGDTAQEPAPADLSNVEGINNLDTARMALRWALERLHSLQLLKEEAERKTAGSETSRRKAEEDRKDLERVLQLRGQEDGQRAAYYAKLEAYLSQHFAGKLDLTALIKREVATTELDALLHDRQLHLEKEYAARREQLDAQLQRAKFETQQAAAEETARAKASVLESRQNLERGFAVKLAELTDQEVRLKTESDALAQRQAQFESFCREQRARLELDIKAFHDGVEDQMRLRIDSAERFIASRHDSANATWNREKTTLLQEIDDWREKALTYVPRLCEIEKKLLEAQEASAQAQLDAQTQIRRQEAVCASLQAERATLAEDLAQARRQHEADRLRLHEIETQLAGAEASISRLSLELGAEKARTLQLRQEAAEQEAVQLRRMQAAETEKRRLMEVIPHRLADVDALEAVLIGRFKDLEADLHHRDMAWKEREEVLRDRDRDWHVRLSEWQAELNRKAHQLEAVKDQLLETIQSYKTKIALAENPRHKGE